MLEKAAGKMAVERKKEALDEARKRESRLSELAQESAIKMSSLVEIVSDLENEIEGLRDQYAVASGSHENAQMWRQQNAQVRKTIVNGDERLADAANERDTLQDEIHAMAEKRERLASQYTALMAEKGKHVQTLRVLSQTNATYRTWIAQNSMLKAHVDRLGRVNARLQAAIADAQSASQQGPDGAPSVHSGEHQARLLKTQHRELQDSLTQLRAELDLIRAETERILSQDYQHLDVIADDILSIVQFRLTTARLKAASTIADKANASLRTKVSVEEPKLEALAPRASSAVAAIKPVLQMADAHAELLATREKLLGLRSAHVNALLANIPELSVQYVPDKAPAVGDDGNHGLDASTGEIALMEAKPAGMLRPLPKDSEEMGAIIQSVSEAANETALVEATEARIRDEVSALMIERKEGRAALELSLLRDDNGGGSSSSGGGEGASSGLSSAQMLETLLAEHCTIQNTAFIKFLPESLDSDMPKIRCATLPHLVRQLTFPTYPDTEFVHEFLLTYRSVAQPEDIMSLFLERWCVTCPVQLEAEHEEEFNSKIVRPIRLRVVNFLRLWASTYALDFDNAPGARSMLLGFVENIVQVHVPGQAKFFESILRKYNKTSSRVQSLSSMNVVASLPKLSKRSSTVKSFDKADVKTLAHCINSTEFDIFSAIQPRECFGLAWSKSGREESSPNVLALIQRFNAISTWVGATILEAGENEKSLSKAISARARTIKKMVALAVELYERNNLNGTMEILAGLSSNAIYRLQATWAKVDSKTMAKHEALNETFATTKSWKALRERQHAVNPPLIPYLGLYLTDLTFIEDGNAKHVNGGLVNVAKMRKFAAVLREIARYQDVGYSDEVDVGHHLWLERAIDIAVSRYPDADAELYQKSLEVEPRQ